MAESPSPSTKPGQLHTSYRDRDLWLAIRRYQRARELAGQQHGERRRLALGHAAHGIAIALGTLEMDQEALHYAQEAIDLLSADLSVGFPPHVTYGATLLALGRYRDAVVPLEDAVRRRPLDVVANYNLACAYARVGDAEEFHGQKQRRYQRAIETLRKLHGKVGSDMRTIDQAETDPDFAGLRENITLGPVFTQAIRQLQEAG